MHGQPMKIYTRTGDQGETSLYGGERVSKSHIRIETVGLLDELNSLLGIVVAKLKDKRVDEFINRIQKDLFHIGSNLAKKKTNLSYLSQRVEEMEKVIDTLSSEMPNLSNFIIPEGTEVATFLFFTRAVARKAERELVILAKTDTIDDKILVYFNRLSDFLFTLARYLNFKEGIVETIWKES